MSRICTLKPAGVFLSRILAVSVLVLAVAGCMRTRAPALDEEVTAGESDSYGSGQELYKQGDYGRAAEFFRKATEEFKDPAKIAAALYMVSLCEYRAEQYSDAILTGKSLEDAYSTSQYLDDALLVVAKSYERKGSLLPSATYFVRLLTVSKDSRLVTEAEKSLDRLVKEKLDIQQLQKLARAFPDVRFAPMFLFHAARAEIAAERRSRAAALVRRIQDLYAGTEYADRALGLLGDLAGEMAKRSIGLLLPLNEEFYVYGMAVQRGVELGLDTSKYVLVTYDTDGDPVEALKATRTLIEDDDVLAIIGPVLSMPTIAAAAIANTKGVVLVSPTSTEGRISTIGPYVFQLNLSLQSQAEAIADFALSSLGLFDIAIIYPMDAYGEGLSRVFMDRVTSLGGRVLTMKGYEQGTTDFRDQIAAVKASAPQAVFIPAYPDDIVLIAPQLRYYEFEGTVLGAGGWHSEKVTRLGEEYVEGAIFASVETGYSENTASRAFERLYESLYTTKPSRHSALGYDAIQLVQNASQDPGTTREALMERLSMVTSFRGASGAVSLASRDEGTGRARIYTIHRGAFKQIQ
jgi:branched-chain amino acid transport system substrate-binding protein